MTEILYTMNSIRPAMEISTLRSNMRYNFRLLLSSFSAFNTNLEHCQRERAGLQAVVICMRRFSAKKPEKDVVFHTKVRVGFVTSRRIEPSRPSQVMDKAENQAMQAAYSTIRPFGHRQQGHSGGDMMEISETVRTIGI